jgi:hypothetical protein
MKDEAQSELRRTRRIVVSDDSRVRSGEIRGRRLESPPSDQYVDRKASKSQLPGKPKLLVIAGIATVVIAVVAVICIKRLNSDNRSPVAEIKVTPERPKVVEPNDLRRIEEQAKQVIRVMSRDNRPYSFSEKALKEIQLRSVELSRSAHLLETLHSLQTNGELVASMADREGLPPSLVMLVGLAMTNGGKSADSVKAAIDAVPLLASLNKTFGSNEGDSCLILVAAFREGWGTRRSHPLLRRMNRVVTNPLTERNVWYLNEQRVFSVNAYALVIDTIAFGVITRSPREFGLDSDPLNF